MIEFCFEIGHYPLVQTLFFMYSIIMFLNIFETITEVDFPSFVNE